MPKRFNGSAPESIPPSAAAMYAANTKLAMAAKPVRIKWSGAKGKMLKRLFSTLKSGVPGDPERAGWIFISATDKNWASPEIIHKAGKRFLRGNCNDFAPFLMRALQKAGIPRGAMRLVVCSIGGVGHLVLAIETQRETRVCCNIKGCWPLSSNQWKSHHWIAWEGHDGAWESLRSVSLSDLVS